MSDDPHAREPAHGEFAADVDPPVDVGSVRLTAGNQVAALQPGTVIVGGANQPVFPGGDVGAAKLFGGGLPFHEDVEGSAHERLSDADRHLVLGGHRGLSAPLTFLVPDLPGHGPGARAILPGIGEHPKPLEPCLTDELHQ